MVNNIVANQIKVYVIIQDESRIEKVETMGMSKEQIKDYLNQKAQNEKDKKNLREDSDSNEEDEDEEGIDGYLAL